MWLVEPLLAFTCYVRLAAVLAGSFLSLVACSDQRIVAVDIQPTGYTVGTSCPRAPLMR